jgi:hypothetical protein
MQITRISGMTGVEHTREIDVEQEQLDAWDAGLLIQEAMPQLDADDREFIMTGITPSEWDDTFGSDDTTKYRV